MNATKATLRRFHRARRAEELRRRGIAVNTIADQLGVTVRQIHRDLQDLPGFTEELGGGLR